MHEINFTLPQALNDFIQQEVASGRYDSPGQYMEALVRLAQNQKARRAVDSLLVEGLESGEPTALTSEDWEDIRQESRQRSLEQLKDAASDLPLPERAELSEFLVGSLDESQRGQVRAEWLALAERRMVDVKAGKVVGIPADVVLKDLLGLKQ